MYGFYMIYLEGGEAPKVRHASLESATMEAKRLSREFGKRAFILCSITSVEFDAYKINKVLPSDHPDDLPF